MADVICNFKESNSEGRVEIQEKEIKRKSCKKKECRSNLTTCSGK